MATAADFGQDDLILRSDFGVDYADCAGCPLNHQCRVANRAVRGEYPRDWQPGGLMIVGEGPGETETSMLRPFQGRSGKLLDALLESAGIERRNVWVTNATMGLPRWDEFPTMKEKQARIQRAVYHCLPRLLHEIAFAKPRVIVTLGAHGFSALHGHSFEARRLVDNPCSYVRCDASTRKVFPAISCTKCSWFTLGPDYLKELFDTKEELVDDDGNVILTAKGNPRTQTVRHRLVQAWAEEVKDACGGECPSCGGNINRLQPRAMKCPECGGKKKSEEHYQQWTDGGFKLRGREGVVGAVFPAESLASALHEYGVRYVIPTFHPSFVLRGTRKGNRHMGGQFAAPVVVDHLAKAQRLLTEDTHFEAEPKVLNTADDVDRLRKRLQGRRAAADIETNYKGGAYGVTEITVLGIATADEPEGWVIDTRGITFDRVWEGKLTRAQDALLKAIERLLTDPAIELVWWNGLYDRVVMGRMWGILCTNTGGDGMASHIALRPNEEHGLGFVAHELTDAPHWKESDAKEQWKDGTEHALSGFRDFDSLALYNARDTRVTALIDETLNGSGGNPGRLDLEDVRDVAEVDKESWDLAVRMTLVGMPMDQGTLKYIAEQHREVMATTTADMIAELDKIEGDDWVARYFGEGGFSPSNNNAIRDILYDADGPYAFEPTKLTATGNPSADKNVLRALNHVDFVRHLLKYREYSYRLSHYIEGSGLDVDPVDGRLHVSWMPKLVTGRWSSSPNLQNWPYVMREAVRAPKGRKLVGADYGQLEVRGIAILSEDEALIAKCLSADESRKTDPDYDPHAFVASHVFGDTFLSLPMKKGDDHVDLRGVICSCGACTRRLLRDVTKRVIYALNYGSGAPTIRESIYDGGYEGPPVTVPMIERVISTVFDLFPGIPRWRNAQLEFAHETREIRSPILGRRRVFPLGEIEAPTVYNFPIQSLAADLMTLRVLELDKRMPHVDETAAIIAQVHDAVYVECREEKAEEMAALVTDTLTCRWSPRDGVSPMVFPADASIADTWDKC